MHSSINVSGVATYERRGHDVAHGGLLVGAALERHAPEIVALGDDADDLALFRDEQRADVRVDHLRDRLEDGRLAVDLQYVAALLLEDRGQQLVHHDLPPPISCT